MTTATRTRKRPVSSTRQFEILNTQTFVTNADIQEILGVSSATASGIIKDIKDAIIKDGKKPYYGGVSVERFMDYTGKNIKHYEAAAKRERAVNG